MREAKIFLAGLLHIPLEELEEALQATQHYKQFRVKKQSGGSRILSVPAEPLKKIQRLVLRRILYKIPLTRFFNGYRIGGSILANVCAHLRSKLVTVRWLPAFQSDWPAYFLEVDLKNAFDNVKLEHFQKYSQKFFAVIADLPAWYENQIQERIHRRQTSHLWDNNCPKCVAGHKVVSEIRAREIVYPPQLIKDLKRFLGSHPDQFWVKGFKSWLKGNFEFRPSQLESFGYPWFIHPGKDLPDILKDVVELLFKLCFYRNSLPQGAPTSGYLLNLAIQFSGITHELFKLNHNLAFRQDIDDGMSVQEAEFQGSRIWFELSIYADNFVFSSSHSFNSQLFINKQTVADKIVRKIEEGGLFKVNQDKIRMHNVHKGCPRITGLSLTPKGIALAKKRIRWLRSFIHHAAHDKKRQEEVRGHFAFLKMIYGQNLPHQLRPKL